MRRSIRLSGAAFICTVIALASSVAASQEHSQLVDTGVIFSAQQVERSPRLARMIGITPPFWAPSREEIALLEAKLKRYLEGETPPEAKVIAARLGSYKRQYVGYTEDSKRRILVNGFCEEHLKEEDAWRDRLVVMFDGGPCFFTVRYDTSRSRFEYLLINGG